MNGGHVNQMSGCVQNVNRPFGIDQEKTKKCTKCNRILFVIEFGNNSRSKDGKQCQCKYCIKQYTDDNKERISRRNRERVNIKRGRPKDYKYVKKTTEEKKKNKAISAHKYYLAHRELKKIAFPHGIKKCSKCGTLKYFCEFNNDKHSSDGLTYQCKDCRKKSTKNWQLNNKERIRKKLYKWRENNKDKHKAICNKWRNKNTDILNNKHTKWCNNNKDRVLSYCAKYRNKNKNVPKFKISRNISCAIHHSIGNKRDGNNWEVILGFTRIDLINHLEALFKQGMSWENYGKGGWHIDHKIPKSYFNFSSINDDQFKECWCLKNLQPLWEVENLRKKNRFISE